MPEWQAYPSAFSTGVNRAGRTLVDPPESIGSPSDTPATDLADENSVFSLLKAALSDLGVPAGTGTGVVNAAPKVFGDLLATLGDISDAPAASIADSASAIALTKRVLEAAGL
jgi:ribose 5-phosphate isomerase RpiB